MAVRGSREPAPWAVWRVLLCIQMLNVAYLDTSYYYTLKDTFMSYQCSGSECGKPTAGGVGYNNLVRSYYLARNDSSVWMNVLPGTPGSVLLVHAFRPLLPRTACKYLFQPKVFMLLMTCRPWCSATWKSTDNCLADCSVNLQSECLDRRASVLFR